MKYWLYPLGDNGITVEFGRTIDLETHKKVKAFSDTLDRSPFLGLIEYVPAYTTVSLFYDLTYFSKSPYQKVCQVIEGLLANLQINQQLSSRIVKIPVCYGGEFGPDLEFVAKHNNLSEEEVIRIHSSGEYLVYMIGFAPGFPYLGGMPEQIATPRRSSPRLIIPAGSVGIAGKQTGVYPIETPGGWQLIGRTPLTLFQPQTAPPSLLQSGDQISFIPISKAEYESLKGGGEWA